MIAGFAHSDLAGLVLPNISCNERLCICGPKAVENLTHYFSFCPLDEKLFSGVLRKKGPIPLNNKNRYINSTDLCFPVITVVLHKDLTQNKVVSCNEPHLRKTLRI